MSKRERNLLFALGVVGVAAVALFFLTRGGGESAEEQTQPQAQTQAPAAGSPAATVAQPGAVAIVGNPLAGPDFRLTPGGRDPFVPLVVPPEGTGGTGTSAPAPPPEPVGTTGTDTGDDHPQGVTIGGRILVLVDIFERKNGRTLAHLDVDQRTYLVAEGQTFAGEYRLLAIDERCVSISFRGDSYRLCLA